MGEMSPWHWAIVIGVAILLFGARRLPDAARSLGRSARILKAELRDAGPGAAPPDDATAGTDAPPTVASTAPSTAAPATTTGPPDAEATGTRPASAPPGSGTAEVAAPNGERAAG